MHKHEKHLRDLVRMKLHSLRSGSGRKSLPRLYNLISTDNGFETAEDIIFNISARDGVSVQSAMAGYDSDLTDY